MNSALSAKLNKIYQKKQEIRSLEDELRPLIDEVKAIVLEGTKDENGLWTLENGRTRACVIATIKINEVAVPYLQGIGRDDLISIKSYVAKEALAKIMGEEEMAEKGLASFTYSLKVTAKNKE